MSRRTTPKSRFAVSVCSICEKMVLCLGDQTHGGIRLCVDCWPHTLAWVQMGVDRQQHLRDQFAEAAKKPSVRKQLKEAESVSDDLAKAIALGEARKRAFQAAVKDR